MELREVARDLRGRVRSAWTWVARLPRAMSPSDAVQAPSAAMIVSQSAQGRLHCVRLRGSGNDRDISCVEVADAEQAAAVMAGWRKGWPVILVLSKSHYLIKKLSAAPVSDEEMHGMLELEASAALPPQFGPVEVSYRLLERSDGKAACCEVYLCRRETVEGCLEELAAWGIRPDYVLPSAVVWRQVLGVAGDIDLLLVCLPDGHAEAACLDGDGACSVRFISPADGEGANRSLIECIRSIKGRNGDPSAVVTVGCVGGQPVSSWLQGLAVLRRIDDRFVACSGTMDGQGAPLSHLAASVAASKERFAAAWRPQVEGIAAEGLLHTANLLPRRLVLAAKARAVYRTLAVAGASLLLAVVLLYSALQIAIHRYRRVNEDLTERIGRIKAEGEAVGWQIAQLEAVRSLRASSGDLLEIIAGLTEGTPREITYSDVELLDSGDIRLHGQAESVSLPFLLPENLQKQPQFKRVVLQSVGQKQQGAGSATDFRMDCELARKSYK